MLDDHVTEIHEQDFGHRVFARTPDYDTASDNLVHVHASTLRKRLEQYFLSEGIDEPAVIELPKGNYAPVFRDRPVPELLPTLLQPEPVVSPERKASGALSASEARSSPLHSPLVQKPAVRQFWSQVFRPGLWTDIVLDDAGIGLYQELSGRTIGLSNYFDRDYRRGLGDQSADGKLDPETAKTMVLKRQTLLPSTIALFVLASWNE